MMNEKEIKLGDWVFNVKKSAVYYTFESAFHKGTKVNCRRINITMTPGEPIEITAIDIKIQGSKP